MSYNKIGILLVLVSLFYTVDLSAQSKKQLEQKNRQTKKQIKLTEQLLKKNRESKSESVKQLSLIDKQIQFREELITTISDEINVIQEEIDENASIIQSLEDDLAALKAEYAKMIRYAYKNKNSYDKMIFVLSAEDFNKAYKRLKYIQQYTEYRKKQAKAIEKTNDILKLKLEELEVKKAEKSGLITEKQEERIIIEVEKNQQKNLLAKLQGKEQELKINLTKQYNEAKKLQKQIADIIRKEQEAAIKRANKSGTVSKEKFPLSPADKLISDNFGSNKGRLPWPTERGIVISNFGKHAHKTLRGVTIENNGIDIGTTENSKVKAIFDGEVSKVASIPGYNNMILVKHGNYFTLYAKLDKVNVKRGDKVKAKQVIGTVYTDKTEGVTELHIEIWKEFVKLNPKLWLSKK